MTSTVGQAVDHPAYQLLWAKTSRGRQVTHPLICHLVDVGEVALALWRTVLTDGLRGQVAEAVGVETDAAGRLLAFWAALHDVGKASPAFQRQHEPSKAALSSVGLSFPRVFGPEPSQHGLVSADSLERLLEAETGLPPWPARLVARAVGGHHGVWPLAAGLQGLKSTQKGDQQWEALRRDLLCALKDNFEPPLVQTLGQGPEERNALLVTLSGLTTVADWIGSMETYFPHEVAALDLRHYTESAEAQAGAALAQLGWTGWEPPVEGVAFQDLFGFSARPIQEVVVELARRLDRPSLVIIEAPTGVGKTEAALYLADHWAHSCRQRGLYVAMPTMATSNQMFGRVKNVLARRYPESLVNLHLVHGQARWSGDMQALRMEVAEESGGGRVAAMAWFLPHKRSLLAPFAVGTVDQSLLGVLQTKHFFVRLFGLGHKTVIFDEVHAYDTYMSAIFQRLLGWLRALGVSVVILSATLPSGTRWELLEAYAGTAVPGLPLVEYPCVTWAESGHIGALPLPPPPERVLKLGWVGRDPEEVAACLRSELKDGGCAAIICNTVGRAQEVYRALKEGGVAAAEELILFHARFPMGWRDEVEKKVLSRFGKEGNRPHRAIVVATQVIEQSLDLDFDFMVTDLAPADLMLQRAGRLHRHERPNRPPGLASPRLIIVRPPGADGISDFGPDVHVYEPYVLLRSYLAVCDREEIRLPADTADLIEAVYGEGELPSRRLTPVVEQALADSCQRMERREAEHVYKAKAKLVASPDADDLLDRRSLGLEEDNPELHEALQALTRLVRPGVSLVCLQVTPRGLVLEPEVLGPVVDLEQEPDEGMTWELAKHTVTVSHYPVVQHFLAGTVPPGWRDHPLLHNHRAAVFTEGVCPVLGTRYTLRLSRELGLEIDREEE